MGEHLVSQMSEKGGISKKTTYGDGEDLSQIRFLFGVFVQIIGVLLPRRQAKMSHSGIQAFSDRFTLLAVGRPTEIHLGQEQPQPCIEGFIHDGFGQRSVPEIIRAFQLGKVAYVTVYFIHKFNGCLDREQRWLPESYSKGGF